MSLRRTARTTKMRAGVARYSDSGVSLSAAAAVLTGRLTPAGRLPVAHPGRGRGPGVRLQHGFAVLSLVVFAP
jgi:hypothetical protein